MVMGAALAAAVTALVSGCAHRAPQAPAKPNASAPSAPNALPEAGLPSVQGAVRTWDEYRLRAAKRMVAANPDKSYTGTPPDPLLAIPVLDITVKADGSIDRIDVVRVPTQAKDTVELAKEAVRRAAPFGEVGRLPKPWKFRETFLYGDDRRFKPMILDQ
ncbi:MAG: hypothetical protein C4K60_07735 [Ideonella sp. MAG2]|nr:MAG: hypothetical protein C4K60_07735 [Ideonella sp. MAG2]